MMQSTEQATFPIAQSRAIVRDLFQPNPLIYWADFLITLTVAYGCAAVYFFSPLFSLQQIVFLVISGLALHRLANYIHEVAHLNAKRSLRAFQVAWNILAGIPMLMPSYFFETHIAHHNPNQFGTGADCEYVPLGRRPLRSIAMFMGQVLLQPLFVIIRFVLVTPISFLHPKLRQWVLENYSAFVFIWPCPRKISEDAPRAAWAAMDIACWLRATAIFGLVVVGVNPWYRIPQLYVLALFPLGLHYARSLTAHRYLSDGEKTNFHQQIFDSIDISGDRFFTELLYPIGLRYHALHHLFPSMPYHNLGIAHRRLMAELPADSPYRQLVYPSFRSVIKELLQHSREVSARERQMNERPPDGPTHLSRGRRVQRDVITS